MALAMTRPWRHPATSIFWLRKRVPDDLRALVGKSEIKRSLGTRDPGEAKRLLAAALVELEQQWANLRAGPRSLTEREAHDLAVQVYDGHLAEFRDNPSAAQSHFWNASLGGALWEDSAPPFAYPLDASDAEKDAALKSFIGHVDVHWSERNRMRDWCETRAAQILSQNGLIVDEASHARLAKAVAGAMQQATRDLQQNSTVSYDFAAGRQQSTTSWAGAAAPRPKVGFKELLDGWAKETKPAAKTIYTWSRVFDQLAKFLGHDDAQRVTADDIIRWKGVLIEGGLRAKSVRDSRLAPIRAVLGWGANNRKLPQNVAERVTIDVKSKPSERRRGYTDEEAALLLRDARLQKSAHRRWVPWLCAYTGARVSEICQLRVEDVRQVEGIWSLHITADAGSVKNAASERVVPLHSAILGEGFLDFVQSRKSGPLFTELKPDRFGNRGGNGTKVLGRWVRDLGVVDARISPNHSWRHRFKTLARRHALATDLVDAMVGHQRRTVADSYGEFPASALQRQLEKIPPFLALVESASAVPTSLLTS